MQICQGLQYMHLSSPPLAHMDLKPANILVSCNLYNTYFLVLGTFFAISIVSLCINTLYIVSSPSCHALWAKWVRTTPSNFLVLLISAIMWLCSHILKLSMRLFQTSITSVVLRAWQDGYKTIWWQLQNQDCLSEGVTGWGSLQGPTQCAY